MRKHKQAMTALLMLTVGIGAPGCRTMRPMEPITGISAPQAFAKIEIGDLVSIEMKDGSHHRFEVRGIEGETLVADSGRRYPRSEMTKLEHETVDASRTVGLVAGVTAGYAVVMKIMESTNFFGR
jgi:hypothetical protein